MRPTSRRATAALLSLATLLTGAFALPAAATQCTREQFANAVDAAGAALRAFNTENSPKVQARVKELQAKRGWSNEELENRAIEYLHSPRIAELDETANKLLTRIDELGDVRDPAAECARLDDLKRTGDELLGVVRTKSQLTLAALDAQLSGKALPRETAEAKPAAASAPPAAKPPAKVAAAPAAPSVQPSAKAPVATPAAPWRTETDRAIDAAPDRTADLAPPPAGASGVRDDLPSLAATDTPDGYTIDEVQAATRGFFGTISTGLGSVIEYAFSRYGRPAGYVLGTEGGGAFLAGVRYGKGELFTRSGERRPVYWHGPSLGYDFGAEGSRTLFLIYHLADAEQLFRSFAGVDGSAYLVGGVGLTVLKGGPVLMAPIRTGVGLRLGANVGYVRFTPRATWNPF